MSFQDHADKVGIVGATVAALCCLGIPAVLSVLTAIGAGFLIHDAILAPLLIASVMVIVWGLVSGRRRHRNMAPLVIGVLAGATLFLFSFVHPMRPLAYAAIAALAIASILNIVLLKHPRTTRSA